MAKKPYRTKYDEFDIESTQPGRFEKETYKAYYDADGTLCLKEDGKINTYDEIQSHKESCDLYTIIEQCRLLGTDEPLKQKQGFYGDFVGTPQSLSEALNLIERGKDEFMSLPVEVRAQFGHDYKRYISMAGSAKWYAAVGSIFAQPEKEVGTVPKVAVSMEKENEVIASES